VRKEVLVQPVPPEQQEQQVHQVRPEVLVLQDLSEVRVRQEPPEPQERKVLKVHLAQRVLPALPEVLAPQAQRDPLVPPEQLVHLVPQDPLAQQEVLEVQVRRVPPEQQEHKALKDHPDQRDLPALPDPQELQVQVVQLEQRAQQELRVLKDLLVLRAQLVPLEKLEVLVQQGPPEQQVPQVQVDHLDLPAPLVNRGHQDLPEVPEPLAFKDHQAQLVPLVPPVLPAQAGRREPPEQLVYKVRQDLLGQAGRR